MNIAWPETVLMAVALLPIVVAALDGQTRAGLVLIFTLLVFGGGIGDEDSDTGVAQE